MTSQGLLRPGPVVPGLSRHCRCTLVSKLKRKPAKQFVTPSGPLPLASTFAKSIKRSFEGFAGSSEWIAALMKRGVVDETLVSEIEGNPFA